MREINRDIVAAILVSKDNKILQVKKNSKRGGVYIDCWHVPGGGIEEGEELVGALKREILEETGIDIGPYKIELFDDKGTGKSEKTLKSGEKVMCNMRFGVYKVSISDKMASEIKVRLNGDELEVYSWTAIEELKKEELAPPSVELFTRKGWIK
jgi:8-oxo-dGTP pyrophosphatase MutT (NUDIX family)